MGFLVNPAFWASLGVLLIVVSVAVSVTYASRVIMLIAAICAVVGIVESLWHAGHRVRYEPPPKATP